VGFGYIGSCLGVTLADRGLTVVGIDSDLSMIAELRSGRCAIPEPGLAEAIGRLAGSPRLTFTDDHDAVREVDVVVITVGTPVDQDGALVTAQLEDVCRQLAPRLRAGQLVILKSTVSPGITRTVVAPLLEGGGLQHGRDFGLAYCPERLAEGSALAQLRELTVVVGGCGPDSSAAAARFWRTALDVPVQTVPTSDIAEIVKLATNWWIDANIAMTNELAQFCALFEVDVLEVIAAANTLPKGGGHVNILLPSVGVGGSCLTKDPWMTWRAARDRGARLHTIETARRVNDEMPEYAFEVIRSELVKMGKDPASAKVAILGASFKSDTGDLRDTPVKGVVRALRGIGAEVRVFDPLADPAEIDAELGCPPAPTFEHAVAGADCVAVLAGHRAFHDIVLERLRELVAMPCLVFDGRMYYPPETIRRLRELGFGYRGIGR
jgi:UDP-N-acetyl-D-mannosaminuronic acid dehydrogenase